jgi:putative transposase
VEIRKGRHIVYLLHAHLVFVTKRRGKVFGAAYLKRLEEIFWSVCTNFEVI